ncbi:MAG: cell division protein FtsQ/DivIB, partial [Staphylococcus epidermidis]|nr:cell division protein FtsQ/DivIB [Staphylococcus epidermidis]
SRQSTEDDEEFLLDHRSEQQPKASRHSKKHKLLSKFTSKKEKETSTSFNSNEKVTQIKPLSLEEKRAIRRKKQKRIQYTIITLLILIIVLILLYMFTPLSKISNVNIKGNNNVSTSKIKKELNVTSRSRMYTFSKNKAIRNLKQNPLIKEVDIHKQLPNTLTVNVTEYQIVGLEKNKDKYVPIIEDGKELTEYKDEVSHDGPIIDGFKGDKKTRIIKALSEMSPKVRNLIAEVSYAPTKNKQSRIKIFTKDNMQVIGDITTIADKMQYYPQMSQSLSRDDSGELKTNGYIDLSVGASFIPYQGSSTVQSGTEQNVTKSTQEENDAKEELQNVLNKINKQSKENN